MGAEENSRDRRRRARARADEGFERAIATHERAISYYTLLERDDKVKVEARRLREARAKQAAWREASDRE